LFKNFLFFNNAIQQQRNDFMSWGFLFFMADLFTAGILQGTRRNSFHCWFVVRVLLPGNSTIYLPDLYAAGSGLTNVQMKYPGTAGSIANA